MSYWKKKCPALKGMDKKSHKAIAIQSDSEDLYTSAFTSAVVVCYTDEWILDSKCTFYMCLQIDWFTTFEQTYGRFVYYHI